MSNCQMVDRIIPQDSLVKYRRLSRVKKGQKLDRLAPVLKSPGNPMLVVPNERNLGDYLSYGVIKQWLVRLSGVIYMSRW